MTSMGRKVRRCTAAQTWTPGEPALIVGLKEANLLRAACSLTTWSLLALLPIYLFPLPCPLLALERLESEPEASSPSPPTFFPSQPY